MVKKVNFGDVGCLFVEVFKELWLLIIIICFILVILKIIIYGGLSNVMG